MNYAKIKCTDIANGPGVRVSLFVSGCRRRCPGCFNPEAWDFQYGQPFTEAEEDRIIAALAPEHIKGLSLLGGEPLEPENQQVLAAFLRRLRQTLPNKTVWCYTGFTFEELYPDRANFLRLIDILVDGAFVEDEKDLNLRFRGSDNQRILDMPRSLKAGAAVLWDGEMTLS